ncbi:MULTISPECIES: alpha/beta hydrolase [unclassified Micromonospora]|uniref:alpha/beta hydrolase n=1 Tax=unclassified Micromonospora TaxID=2617518 RepID=UPI00098D7044|nr:MULTISPECIES: alpha/beta hydrolase [unclassified Micromonospora]MDI5936655.1 alpha/beta hydrolase [Micromonospora sp. DH15]OON32466.1 esterase [Micromonospora sp. Rc5]
MTASPPEQPPLGPPPSFDAELDGPLREIRRHRPVPLTAELIPHSRARTAESLLGDDEIRRRWPYDVRERLVPGPPGDPDVALVICRPTWVPGPWPVIYNTHGGGMVSGSHRAADLADELARAQQVGAAVVAVDYRLAPENPDPAPVRDCYAGLVWLAENARELGMDPDRIVVSGNSAGGGLAAGISLLARDRGGPPVRGQMLQCPMLDDRCDTPSARQMVGVGLWDHGSNLTGWTALLGDRRATDAVSCYAAPARAIDLSGLPPAFIDVGAVEALRDEAGAFATRIWQAGGEAELHVWSGAFHSFDWWVPHAAVSRAAMDARVVWLRRLFSR